MNTTHALPRTAGYHDVRIGLPSAPELPDVAISLHLPTRTQRAPLVVVLHYGGPPSGYYGRGLLEQLVVPAWEALGAVFVAPVIQGGAGWQAAPNPATIRALLTLIESHYETATDARYLVGYSLGAIGCWHWLMEPAAPFAAVVPIAGRVPEALASFSTPAYALHSHADQLFPSAPLEARLEALRNAGCPLSFRVLDGIDHFNVGGYREALAALVSWLPGRVPGS